MNQINNDSSEDILTKLHNDGMLSTETIMESAVKLYNENANVEDISQARAVIESLKMFIKVYQFYNEENEGRVSMFTPKILMFIALCNYKIDNINRAYCIAKQGLEAVDKAIENSTLTGIPSSIYGADILQELINTIEKEKYDEVVDADNYNKIDPTDIDISKFEKLEADILKPSKTQIRNLIETISHIQAEFSIVGEHENAFRVNKVLETFKIPLCFAWQGYKYGWHTDFCKEGDSLLPFMMFEMNIQKNTKDLIDLLKSNSPFSQIERNSAITNALIHIYTTFIKDIDNKTIKI